MKNEMQKYTNGTGPLIAKALPPAAELAAGAIFLLSPVSKVMRASNISVIIALITSVLTLSGTIKLKKDRYYLPTIIAAVLTFIISVFVLMRPSRSSRILNIVVGTIAAMGGASNLFKSFFIRRDGLPKWLAIAFSGAGLAFGILLMCHPARVSRHLMRMCGISLISMAAVSIYVNIERSL